ncbi:MAG: response regulator [Desulfobacterales bacterium]|nr:response regulator [Desulfobacterales bacterium]MCP4160268.1 response regulator [Deltaproteobacteria bacterium]
MLKKYSETLKNPEDKRLLTLIVVTSSIIFFIISGILLLTTYLITFYTLERESNQYLEKTMDIAEFVVKEKLDNIQNNLGSFATSDKFVNAFKSRRSKIIEKQLYDILKSDIGYFIDTLILTESNTNFRLEASLNYTLPDKFTNIVNKYWNFYDNRWRIINFGSDNYPILLLVWKTPVILPSTGKVTGYLWAGVSMNTNLALLEEIQKHTRVADVAFFYKNNYMVSVNLKDRYKLSILKNKVNLNQTSNPKTEKYLFYSRMTKVFDHDKFKMLISVESDQFKELRKTYTYILILLLITLIISGLFAIFLIRKKIRPSLKNLIEYTELAPYERVETIGFKNGLVKEFNQIGSAVEKMVLKIKEKEESLSKAQSIAKLGNWEWYVEEEVFIFSDELFCIFGLSPVNSKVTKDTFFDMIHKDDKEMVFSVFNDADKKGIGLNIDHRLIRPDNSLCWVHQIIKVLRSNEGIPVKIMGTVQDITSNKIIQDELKIYRETLENKVLDRTKEMTEINELLKAEIKERQQIEDDLREARDLADEANRTKSRFLANMSHEIRTPMNTVIGYIDLSIEDSRLNSEIKDNLLIASRSAGSLLRLLNDILDIGKIEAGKLELETADFNMNLMFQDVFASFEKTIRKKNLELNLVHHPVLLNCYNGDKMRISQILINLIGNAVKFTEKGSITVSVEPDSNNKLLFCIEDTGIGMSNDDIKEILNPFSQVDSSTIRQFGGTGLGTTISKQIVEIMGGSMWIESEPGKGSKFNFTVLLEKSECPGVCEQNCDHYKKDDSKISTFKRIFNILLAEDIEANAKLATIRIGQHGHKLTHVWNGKEALEACKKGKFDVILMDVQMPVMDGLEACTLIRQTESENDEIDRIPIIAMTANVMEQDKEEYYAVGMDGVVGKPVDYTFLINEMEKIVPYKNRKQILKIYSKKDVSIEDKFKGINFKKGLALWQNESVYKNMLIDFIKKYEHVTEKIRELIGSSDFSKCERVVHSLKGLSGNLALDEVHSLCEKLGHPLKLKQKDKIYSIIDKLFKALSVITIDVMSIKTDETDDIEEDKPEIDVKKTSKLIELLLDAIEQDELSVAEMLLENLSVHLSKSQLKNITSSLSNFDFTNAKNQTLELAKSVNINLGGTNEE